MERRLKTLFSKLSDNRLFDSATLFLRIFIGAMMLPLHIGSVASFNLIIIIEAGCSALLIMGLMTRLATIPLIAGMFTATFLTFPDKSFADGELSFIYMGVYIALLISGGGRYSLDMLFFPYRRPRPTRSGNNHADT